MWMSFPARRKTITRLIEVLPRSASSTFRFNVTIAPRRYEPSAVTTAVAPLSMIRSRMLSELNPPKTTECTAPIRAQASIAIAASNIRQINDDPIALFDFVPFQHIREAANFTMQLLVGQRASITRFTFPDNRRLVPARPSQVWMMTLLL